MVTNRTCRRIVGALLIGAGFCAAAWVEADQADEHDYPLSPTSSFSSGLPVVESDS